MKTAHCIGICALMVWLLPASGVAAQDTNSLADSAEILIPAAAVSAPDTVAQVDTARTAGPEDVVNDRPDSDQTGESAQDTIAAAGDLRASPAGDPVAQTDRMVVTATRTERRISETPASVSLITSAAIETAPAKTIHDLLVTQTGVVVKRSVGMAEGVPSQIMMRGVPPALAATRMLILVDGIPTNASGTPFLIVNEIPLEAIDRVEIVRGPFSCLYGANAFSGVINIITKEGDGRPRLDVSAETGSAVYWSAGAWSGGGSEALAYSVSGGIAGVENYLMRDEALRRKNDVTVTVDARNYDYDNRRFFGRVKAGLGPIASLNFYARYFDYQVGFGETKELEPTEPVITRGSKILAGPYLTVRPSDQTSFRVGAVYRRTEGEFLNEGLSAVEYEEIIPGFLRRPVANTEKYVRSRWISSGNDVLGEAQATLRLGSAHTITIGMDGLWNSIDFGATDNAATGEPLLDSEPVSTTIKNLGIYAQDEIRLGDAVTVLPGLRGDYHSLFGWVLSPKLGLSYRVLESLTLRTSAGQGFRAPALSELSMPDIVIGPEYKVRANPDLEPEYLWAIDCGVGYEYKNTLWATASGFYNSMRNLITPEMEDLDGLIQGFVSHGNTSRAWNAGLEAELTIAPAKWLTARGGYSYTLSRDDAVADDVHYRDNYVGLDYIPRHKVNIELLPKVVMGNLTVEGSLSEVYTGERGYVNFEGIDANDTGHVRLFYPLLEVTPPYVVLASYFRTDASLKLRYRRRFWIGLAVENATDAKFEESGGTWAPGRMIWVRGGFSL